MLKTKNTQVVALAFGLIGLVLFLFPDRSESAASLAGRLAGRILIQTESRGEAWYIDPVDGRRYYLGRPADAFELMRRKGLGISDSDLETIPLGYANGAAAKTDKRLVTKIVDGDTLVVLGGEHVRLLSIDTDETGEACYKAAGDRLGELVLGKEVELKADKTDKDRYGRILRHVYLEGKHINLQLVDEGLAVCRYYSDNPSFKDECARRERAAMAAGIGCKWQNMSATDVGALRAMPACLGDECVASTTTGCSIKGNISVSSGEKIYHLQSCKDYANTIINTEKGEKWFCSEAEAGAAGWRKAGNCP